jgi:hypothetical protein
VEKLADLLASAAERLGIEAARIWPQLVLWAFARHLADLVLEVSVLAVGAYVILRLVRWYRGFMGEDEYGRGKPDHAGALAVTAGVGVVLGLVMLWAAVSVPRTVAGVVSPEAAAVLYLLGK